MSAPPVARDRGGFALALVVLMLFAIAVAGAAGYQVVSSEFTLAQQNRDGQEALAVARAGLERFIGEQIGDVGASVSYAIGDGVASVTARKVLVENESSHLYYVQSVGEVADPRMPLLPARRTVGTYVWHRRNPIPPKAAMVLTGGQVRLYGNGPPFYYSYSSNVSGTDHATAVQCTGGGSAPTYGIGTAGSIATYGGSYSGTPSNADTHYANFQQVYDTLGVRWDILTNPSFPVDYNDTWPDFATLLALNPNAYPIIRINGNFNAWGSYYSGQGVLIVTGRLVLLNDFVWNGIIMAGNFYYSSGGSSAIPQVNGMLIGGMAASNPTSYLIYADFNFHSCNFKKANEALSYLEVVDNAVFELNN